MDVGRAARVREYAEKNVGMHVYVRNFIYVCKNSMVFSVLIITKLRISW